MVDGRQRYAAAGVRCAGIRAGPIYLSLPHARLARSDERARRVVGHRHAGDDLAIPHGVSSAVSGLVHLPRLLRRALHRSLKALLRPRQSVVRGARGVLIRLCARWRQRESVWRSGKLPWSARLSSAAGEGDYARRLATVFLRPYGLALPYAARHRTWPPVTGSGYRLPGKRDRHTPVLDAAGMARYSTN